MIWRVAASFFNGVVLKQGKFYKEGGGHGELGFFGVFGRIGGDLKRVGVVGIWSMSSERAGDVNVMVSLIFW